MAASEEPNVDELFPELYWLAPALIWSEREQGLMMNDRGRPRHRYGELCPHHAAKGFYDCTKDCVDQVSQAIESMCG